MTPAINKLAREKGNWPDDYQVYKLEATGTDKRPTIRLTGDAPIGFRHNGEPIWPRTKAENPKPKRITVTVEEYRAAITQAAKEN